MKKCILDFMKRGLLASAGGPLVMAIVFFILGCNGTVETLDVFDVVKGILSVTLMAFIAAGITAVYQIEQLPLPIAIGLHCIALYFDYLLIYLFNGLLLNQLVPILIFTGSFLIGFAVIWLFVWLNIRKKTSTLNSKLHK